MGRVLLVVVLVTTLVAPLPVAEATDWSRVAKMMYAATAPIACSLHQQNTCTAFSINRDQGLYLTAKHCIDPYDEAGEDVPQLDGKALQVVFSSDDLDLAIVRSDVKRPALQYRTDRLEIGNEVASLGYGAGFATPMLRTAVVSLFLRDDKGAEWILLDNALISGMSGGPIVDRSGRVIGVNDKSNQYSGMSLSIAQILKATQFWQTE